jgi:hypothetical protein
LDNFGLLFLGAALQINYGSKPQNWDSLFWLLNENRIARYGKGSLGVNLEPCGVIPGVQNGMRVTSVDPSGASAITGVQVGDMIWGADNEGFSEVSAPK